ncbi:MAG: phosphate ABC transporter substrate-binding protein PstS [Alphaproteobacteria bacterium]|nr:phosphate ABC transporter substrate-binding protein PstS [Alphaproteobacteria bacterium]MBL7100023.1 phosphate ABC transporter substrate-binding protein PstS [Alphaproteobacteria bacterium]
MSFKSIAGALVGVAIAATAAMAADISGAGATFPYPIYAKWAATYKGSSGVGLNYQSIGSGGGIAQIKAKTVTFGASDAPMTKAQLDQFGLAQFPTVIGGVVPVVNLRGVAAGQLVLDGATLADIYAGKIARWDDPAIKKLNPGVNLPGQAIAVVHRSDGSGTTFIFTTFLSRVSASWKGSVGAATSVDWPVGIGAKGNEGVAGNVAQTAGSIGYVEYAYAKQNHLTYAKMINKAGKTVSPTVDAFRAAAANADWVGAANNGFFIILVDQPGDASWPITATTYILVYKQPADPAATAEVLKFFKWAYANGGQLALGLDYVPLPDVAVKAIEASWHNIQGSGM